MSSLLVHHSTLAIVPGNDNLDAWMRIQGIRYSLRDRGIYRWPPHINILYPFVPPGEIDVTSIASALQDQSPFEIILQDFQIFGGIGRRGVLWLNPVTAQGGEIQQLHNRITSIYESHPNPRIYSTLKSKPLNPHMTVCHYESSSMAAEMANTLQSEWTPLSFMVKEVLIMERNGDNGQFRIAYRIPLCGKSISENSSELSSVTATNSIPQEIPYLNERFPLLPEVEEDWVREARLLAKRKSKRRQTRSVNQRRTLKNTKESDIEVFADESIVMDNSDR